ncbi:universal stress protein [Kitasatospora sp. NPDC008050]|uniref:universal stress protein n=1 Tax=Kitasatospora sp. NPDC008050 TaxID=3364021 RepID=UPI0036EE6044
MRPEITVGLDGSAESRSAARWAAHEAELRGLPVRLLHLWILRSLTAQNVPGEYPQALAAERMLQDAESDLLRRYPHVPVITELLSADSPAALLPGAPNAEMVVLGSEGLGGVQGYVLGSLALHTVAQSAVPVVLVRAPEEPEGSGAPAARSGAVAVGVSLRAGYDGVLAFAFGAAARRGVPLLIVHAATRRRAADGRERAPDESPEQAEQRELHDALLPWREKFPAVHVVEHISHESPPRAVVDIAPGAGLLVVGRGGNRTGLAPRIGPVAHAAIHHAACPVAVIPHD